MVVNLRFNVAKHYNSRLLNQAGCLNMAIKAAYENLLVFPKGVLEMIAEYHAPMTKEVLARHHESGKYGTSSTLRFNYPLLARDLEEFLRFGEGVGVATKVDRVIRVFALTRFKLSYPHKDYNGGVEMQMCSNNLCDDLANAMSWKTGNAIVGGYVKIGYSSSKDEKNAYPKVHAILCRLEVTPADKGGCSEAVKQEAGTSPVVSLTDEDVGHHSSGTRFVRTGRYKPNEES